MRADKYSEAKASLKNVQVEVDKSSNVLLVKTIQPAYSDGKSYNVDYTISVPSHLNVVVESVNGNISGKLSVKDLVHLLLTSYDQVEL